MRYPYTLVGTKYMNGGNFNLYILKSFLEKIVFKRIFEERIMVNPVKRGGKDISYNPIWQCETGCGIQWPSSSLMILEHEGREMKLGCR